MSIKSPNFSDLHQAGLYGMDSRIDAEVAEDLGIPSSPESLVRHEESAVNPNAYPELSADAISERLARAAHYGVGLTAPDTPETIAQQRIINARRPAVSWEKTREA